MREGQLLLVADYVPIANKGEEAIIRGIEDMFRDHRPIEIGLFDKVDEVTHQGNITIFPWEWIFRVEGISIWSWSIRFKNILFSLFRRLGYYSKLNNLVFSLNPKYRPLQDFFRRAEYIIVGHDGVFSPESCGIIHVAKKAGKCAGVLGMGSSLGRKAGPFKSWLFGYGRAMDESDFWVFREHYSQERMQRICRDPAKLMLAPDPAFAMCAAEPKVAKEVLERYANFRRAREAGRKIVVATVLEKGTVYDHFMPKMDAVAKCRAHAKYLAGIFDAFIRERNAFVIFLPHSIEEGFSDIVAAKHVADAMISCSDDYMILDEDLDARLLKSIINECDFLVGERTHSLISSVSVATPFLALTNHKDSRTHGIIGDMCRCENQIVDMEVLAQEATQRKALALFDDRESIQKLLRETRRVLAECLVEVVKIAKAANVSIQE